LTTGVIVTSDGPFKISTPGVIVTADGPFEILTPGVIVTSDEPFNLHGTATIGLIYAIGLNYMYIL
jgi:hypothetical protein